MLEVGLAQIVYRALDTGWIIGQVLLPYITHMDWCPCPHFQIHHLKGVKSIFVLIQVCFIYQLQKILYTEGSLIVFQSHWLIFPTK